MTRRKAGFAAVHGRTTSLRPVRAGPAGSDGSGRTLLPVRLKVGYGLAERREDDLSGHRRSEDDRSRRSQRGGMAAARANVAGVAAGRGASILAGCIEHLSIGTRPSMVSAVRVRRTVRRARQLSVVAVHAVVSFARRRYAPGALSHLRAHHRRSNRTPQG